jgi:hypothetical protein
MAEETSASQPGTVSAVPVPAGGFAETGIGMA